MSCHLRVQLHFGKPSAFHDIYNASKRWDKDKGLYRTPGVQSGSFVFLKYHEAKERRETLQPMFSKRAIQNIESLVWSNVSIDSGAISCAVINEPGKPPSICDSPSQCRE